MGLPLAVENSDSPTVSPFCMSIFLLSSSVSASLCDWRDIAIIKSISFCRLLVIASVAWFPICLIFTGLVNADLFSSPGSWDEGAESNNELVPLASCDRSTKELLNWVIPIKLDIRDREKARTLKEGTNELDFTKHYRKYQTLQRPRLYRTDCAYCKGILFSWMAWKSRFSSSSVRTW